MVSPTDMPVVREYESRYHPFPTFCIVQFVQALEGVPVCRLNTQESKSVSVVELRIRKLFVAVPLIYLANMEYVMLVEGTFTYPAAAIVAEGPVNVVPFVD